MVKYESLRWGNSYPAFNSEKLINKKFEKKHRKHMEGLDNHEC